MLSSRLIRAALAAAVLLTACTADATPPDANSDATPETNPAVAVVDFVASVVVPYQREAAATASDLRDAAAALCAEPSDAALDTARTAWAAVDVARAAARMVGPGPTTDPVSVAEIDGLGTIELLLFGDGSEALADADDGGDARPCDHLVTATGEVARATDEVLALWVDGDDEHAPFADVLTSRAAVGRSTEQALDEIVAVQLAELDRLLDEWLGPDATTEGSAGNGRAHLSAALGALEDTYGEMTALGPLLPPAQHESVRATIRAAVDLVQGTVGPLTELDEIGRNDQRGALEAVEVGLRTDVAPAFGLHGRTDESATPDAG